MSRLGGDIAGGLARTALLSIESRIARNIPHLQKLCQEPFRQQTLAIWQPVSVQLEVRAEDDPLTVLLVPFILKAQ